MIDPQLLPPTWVVVTLGQVTKIIMGQAPEGSSYNNEEIGMPLVAGAGDLGDFYPQPTKWTTSPTQVCELGDLIYCIRATIGEMNWADREYCVGRGVAAIRANPLVLLPDFMYFWLNVIKDQVVRLGTGSTFLQIRRQDLESIEIPLPTLPEQRRITEILRQADALRRLRKRGFDIFQNLAPSVYSEIFDGNNATHFVELTKIAEIASGVTKGRNLSGREVIEVPYMRVANVQAGYFDLTEIKTIEVLPEELERYRLQFEDVLLTEGGDYDKLGRGALWESQVADCIHQNHIFRVRLDKSKLLPRFFAIYLQTSQPRGYFLQSAKRTTNIASINMSQLKKLPVPLPSMQLQQRFVELLTHTEGVAKENQLSLQKLSDLLTTLLYDAFRGALTDDWRSLRANELEDFVVQRDITLGLQGGEPIIEDYERGRVTQLERDEIERQLLDTSKSVIEALASFQSDLSVSNFLSTVQSTWGTQFTNIFGAAEQIQIPDFSFVVSDILRNAVLELDVSSILMLGSLSSGVADVLDSVVQSPLSNVLKEFTSFFEGWDFADHPRDYVLGELTVDQFRILLACPKAPSNELAEVTQFDKPEGGIVQSDAKAPRAVTLQDVQEAVGYSMDTVRRGLDLLASLGLLAPVSVPAESADGLTFVTAYRSAGKSDNVRLADLVLLKEPGQA